MTCVFQAGCPFLEPSFRTGIHMRAELIATGEEIRCGSVADLNSAWLADHLSGLGVHVARHHTAGDDREELMAVIREAAFRSDLVVVTGGLGPTEDDMTRFVVADAFGLSLEEDPAALAGIRSWFAARNREMPPANRIQARLPEGGVMIPNSYGTAPGFLLTAENCRIFCLPGVPSEMKGMFRDKVRPDLCETLGDGHFAIRVVSTFGLPESEVGERMRGFSAFAATLPAGMFLGLRAVFPEIHIRLYAKACRSEDLTISFSAAQTWVADRVAGQIISFDGKSLAETAGALLKEKGLTLALAESCTGGLIGDQVTSVAGSSDYFLFSGVTYSNEVKTKVLGVREETLAAFGAVSEETAGEMAGGARQVAGADIGLSTTGIAGPGGGRPEKPVGTVCIGFAAKGCTRTKKVVLDFKNRGLNKRLFAASALWFLMACLKESQS